MTVKIINPVAEQGSGVFICGVEGPAPRALFVFALAGKRTEALIPTFNA